MELEQGAQIPTIKPVSPIANIGWAKVVSRCRTNLHTSPADLYLTGNQQDVRFLSHPCHGGPMTLNDDRLHFFSRLFESLKQGIAALVDFYLLVGKNLRNPESIL